MMPLLPPIRHDATNEQIGCRSSVLDVEGHVATVAIVIFVAMVEVLLAA